MAKKRSRSGAQPTRKRQKRARSKSRSIEDVIENVASDLDIDVNPENKDQPLEDKPKEHKMTRPATLMVRREDGGPSKQTLVATTAGDEPNVTVRTLPWYIMVGIRVARVYLQGFVGFLVGTNIGAATAVIPPVDFYHSIITAAGLALAPAVMSLIQNTLEILTKLDVTSPELRA